MWSKLTRIKGNQFIEASKISAWAAILSLTPDLSPHPFSSCLSDPSIPLKIAFISSTGWIKWASEFTTKKSPIGSLSYNFFRYGLQSKPRCSGCVIFLTDRPQTHHGVIIECVLHIVWPLNSCVYTYCEQQLLYPKDWAGSLSSYICFRTILARVFFCNLHKTLNRQTNK